MNKPHSFFIIAVKCKVLSEFSSQIKLCLIILTFNFSVYAQRFLINRFHFSLFPNKVFFFLFSYDFLSTFLMFFLRHLFRLESQWK